MIALQRNPVRACFVALILSVAMPVVGQTQQLPAFTVSKVFTSRGGAHSTTRGNIRLVFPHNNRWLVFHGEPNMYHFSADGLRWTGSEIKEFGTRSHLLEGDSIYSFVDTQTDPNAVTRRTRSAMVEGKIQGDDIVWGPPQSNDLTVGYYADLQRDSTGRFTVSGRVVQYDAEGKPSGMTIDWARSENPGDSANWSPQRQAIAQVSDRQASEIHENVPVEDGRTYVIGMVGVEGKGRLYGNLFDGQSFGDHDTLLAENMSNVRGTDKRMSAVWDPKARVIHLSYVDHDSRLFYRTCKSPYREQDWTAAVQLKPFDVFTNVMSLDTTKSPAEVWLLYGKTMFEHPDPRWQSGELYVEKFDGRSWSEPTLVSEPGTIHNWYPNINEDASRGLGVLYLKGLPPNQAAIKDMDFDIMFSSTGAPRPAALFADPSAQTTDQPSF